MPQFKIKRLEIEPIHFYKLNGETGEESLSYIDAARKRSEDFNKRLENFIAKTHDGKIIKGFGGIEKYY